MPCIDAATFDAKDLTPQSNADNTRVWKTAAGDMVTLYYFSKPQAFRATADDLVSRKDLFEILTARLGQS